MANHIELNTASAMRGLDYRAMYYHLFNQITDKAAAYEQMGEALVKGISVAAALYEMQSDMEEWMLTHEEERD